jgi:hypothetical protein
MTAESENLLEELWTDDNNMLSKQPDARVTSASLLTLRPNCYLKVKLGSSPKI